VLEVAQGCGAALKWLVGNLCETLSDGRQVETGALGPLKVLAAKLCQRRRPLGERSDSLGDGHIALGREGVGNGAVVSALHKLMAERDLGDAAQFLVPRIHVRAVENPAVERRLAD
jgi:hypothetical protein